MQINSGELFGEAYLYSVYICHVTLFSTVFTLWNTRIHVHAMNCDNKASYIKSSVNETLGLRSALSIPYIDPDD